MDSSPRPQRPSFNQGAHDCETANTFPSRWSFAGPRRQGFAVSRCGFDHWPVLRLKRHCLAGATNLQVLQEAINMSLQLAQETSTVAEMDNDEIWWRLMKYRINISGYFRCFNFRPASIAFPCFLMLWGPSGLEVQLHSNKVTILSQPASQPGPPGHPPVTWLHVKHGSMELPSWTQLRCSNMMSVMSVEMSERDRKGTSSNHRSIPKGMFGAGEAFTKSCIGIQTDWSGHIRACFFLEVKMSPKASAWASRLTGGDPLFELPLLLSHVCSLATTVV